MARYEGEHSDVELALVNEQRIGDILLDDGRLVRPLVTFTQAAHFVDITRYVDAMTSVRVLSRLENPYVLLLHEQLLVCSSKVVVFLDLFVRIFSIFLVIVRFI